MNSHRVIVFYHFLSFGCSRGRPFGCVGLLSFYCCLLAFLYRFRAVDRVTAPLGSQQVEHPDLSVC